MSGETSETRLEQLVREYRRTAVLLRPCYPPHAGPAGNSRFGGLPALPADYEWPRTEDGTPLHFFAQVDCAEIAFPTALPDRGVLFFFGRDEEEQIWDDPAEDCRVLYAPDAVAGTPRREPPADLMPIGGLYNSRWREYLREGEPGPNFHVEWPVQPLPIDTWPDMLFDDCAEDDEPVEGETWREAEARRNRYRERLRQLRADAYTRATGDLPGPEVGELAPEWRAAKAIFARAEDGPEAYPGHWITIHYAARALLHRSFSSDPAAHERMAAVAGEWLRRSEEAGPDQPVADEDRRRFRDWLKGLGDVWDETGLGHIGTDLVLLSLVATIRAWAGDAVRAARVPPHVYETLRFYFSPFSGAGVSYSQMLGHAPSAQSPLDPEDSTVSLLNLTSDRGIGWSFGDAGYCTFFIEPGQLAEREFSGAWGTVEGY